MRQTVLRSAAVLWVFGASFARAEPSAFGPGEQATYKVAFLGFQAGKAQVTVGAMTEQWGHKVWPLVGVAETDSVFRLFPMKDRFISYWDPATSLSVGNDLVVEASRRKRRQRMRFRHDEGKVEVNQREGETEKSAQHDISPHTLDMAAATFYLRNQPLEVGQTFKVPVFTGVRSFDLSAVVEDRLTLETAMGEREVFKVRVRTDFSGKLASKRDLFAYFTVDSSHIPVKLEAEFFAGTLVAELTDYKQGRRAND